MSYIYIYIGGFIKLFLGWKPQLIKEKGKTPSDFDGYVPVKGPLRFPGMNIKDKNGVLNMLVPGFKND